MIKQVFKSEMLKIRQLLLLISIVALINVLSVESDHYYNSADGLNGAASNERGEEMLNTGQ